MRGSSRRFGASKLTKLQAHRIGSPASARPGLYRVSGSVHTLRNPGRDDGSWTTGTLHVEHAPEPVVFAAKGLGGLGLGRVVDLEGYWDDHPEFGIQLHIDRVVRSELPRESSALVRYLTANVPAIGKRRAERLVNVLGADVLDRLAEDPGIPQRLWKGATGEAATLGVRQWLKELADERWIMDIAPRLMAVADVTYPLARRICNFFGSAEVADLIIQRDAYRLLDVPGIGWEMADKVAAAMGIEPDGDQRCRGALQWCLRRAQGDGHSAVPRSHLIEKAQELIGVERKRISRACAGLVVDAEALRANGLLYDEQALAAEWDVADLVRWLVALDRRLAAGEATGVDRVLKQHPSLTTEQKSAVRMALTNGISVLTGGSGTGKTTALRVLVEAAEHLGLEVTIVAPTGKAAARATQVTERRAFTIHKLLGGPPRSEREKGPIRHGLVIIEEASMLDLESAAWLASNISPGRDFRLLMVGDEHQLPSVGPGQVLADLLASEAVPSVTLTRILRQDDGSTIAEQAHRLLQGHALVLEEARDFRFVELPPDPARAQKIVVDAVARLVREERSSLVRQVTRQEFNACSDLQVLTPRNTGPLGVEVLNPLLGARLNPRPEPGPWIGRGQRARMGDRVMCVENDYSVGEDGIFNGEQAIVVGFGDGHVDLQMDDGRKLTTRGIQNATLSLAFAATVHKSQGSEYPVVVVVFHSSQFPLLDQRILYTALTRAKQRVVLCADHRGLRIARENAGAASERWTGLRHMLT